ncbi:MAG: VOC family protein [Planctomycetaceae bacterium]
MTVSDSAATMTDLVPLLIVAEIRKSVDFYQQLGFEMVARWELEDGTLGWCRMRRGGVLVMLQQACVEDEPAAGRGHGVAFFINCDDVDKLHAELRSRGIPVGPVETTFYQMKQVYLKDPDGYQLCFDSPA